MTIIFFFPGLVMIHTLIDFFSSQINTGHWKGCRRNRKCRQGCGTCKSFNPVFILLGKAAVDKSMDG